MNRIERVLAYVADRVPRLIVGVAVGVFFTAVAGCRSIRVEKHDPEVIVSSNSVIVVEGGWEAKYWSYGTITSFGRLDIGIATNHTVTVSLSDLQADMSTNHVIMINAAGETAGEIAKKIIEGLK